MKPILRLVVVVLAACILLTSGSIVSQGYELVKDEARPTIIPSLGMATPGTETIATNSSPFSIQNSTWLAGATSPILNTSNAGLLLQSSTQVTNTLYLPLIARFDINGVPTTTPITTLASAPITVDAGGSLTTDIGTLDTVVSFPPGAVREDATLVISIVDNPPSVDGFRLLGLVFDIQVHSSSGNITQFDLPFTISIGYKAEDVVGIGEFLPAINYWDEVDSQWKVIPTVVDPANMRLTATVDHLTVFAALEGLSAPTSTPTPTNTPTATPTNTPTATPVIEWLPNRDVFEALDSQVWSHLAQLDCTQPAWEQDFSSEIGFESSVATLREQLLTRIGDLPEISAGDILDRQELFIGERYSVSWVRMSTRLPGVSLSGYLAQPTGIDSPTPAVIVMFGAGVPANTVFGWRLSGDERFVLYPYSSPTQNVGVSLVESGYTVFVPFLSDIEPDSAPMRNWFEAARWGALLGAKQGGDAYGILVPLVMSAMDFLEKDPQVASSQIALLGWTEGAHVAAVTSAVDERVAATILLSPPVDQAQLVQNPQILKFEPVFAISSCAFGQTELAAMIAPRPLLFSYVAGNDGYYGISHPGTTQNPYVSAAILEQISQFYDVYGNDENFAYVEHVSQADAVTVTPLAWLGNVFAYPAREMPPTLSLPPAPVNWQFPALAHLAQRLEIGVYLAQMGACMSTVVDPDFSDEDAYRTSVAGFREQVRAVIPDELSTPSPIVVLERRTVMRHPSYILEWIRYKGRFTDMELAGYLATPTDRQGPFPAVLSLDGNYGLNVPFGIQPEVVPYTNGYADRLASSGYVVFAPYLSWHMDSWGAIIMAKSNNEQNIWSYLLPLYMSAIDFLVSSPDVSQDKIWPYGISFAGVAALMTTAVDERTSGVVFSNPLWKLSLQVINPSYASFGTPIWESVICGTFDEVRKTLIAPRWLVYENGINDPANWFPENTPQEVVDEIQSIYAALGVPERFRLVSHTGGHESRPSVVLPVLQEILPITEAQ